MRNECIFEGRLSAPAQERQLPSGDVIATFRIIVPRVEAGRVDTIDCSVAPAQLRRRMLAVAGGTEIEVHGALRRRFWRSPAGPASRFELEVTKFRRSG